MRAQVREGVGAAATKLPDGSIRALGPGEVLTIDDGDAELVAWAEGFDGVEILESADPKTAKAAAKARAEAEAAAAAEAEAAAAAADGDGGGDDAGTNDGDVKGDSSA